MAQRKSPSYPEWPVDRSVYSLFCGGWGVAQSVKRATPGEDFSGSISAVATRSLLVVSVSV